MSWFCYVLGCNTGSYEDRKEKYRLRQKVVPLFRVPKDSLQLWRIVVPRSDQDLRTQHSICALHFKEEDIDSQWVTFLPNGTLWKCKKKAQLRKGSVPSIFPKLTEEERIILLKKHAEYRLRLKSKTVSNASDSNSLTEKTNCTEETQESDSSASKETACKRGRKKKEEMPPSPKRLKSKISKAELRWKKKRTVSSIFDELREKGAANENSKEKCATVAPEPDPVESNETFNQELTFTSFDLDQELEVTTPVSIVDNVIKLGHPSLPSSWKRMKQQKEPRISDILTFDSLFKKKTVSYPWTINENEHFIAFLYWKPEKILERWIVIDSELKTKVYFKGVEAHLCDDSPIYSYATFKSLVSKVETVTVCMGQSKKWSHCLGFLDPNDASENSWLCKNCLRYQKNKCDKCLQLVSVNDTLLRDTLKKNEWLQKEAQKCTEIINKMKKNTRKDNMDSNSVTTGDDPSDTSQPDTEMFEIDHFYTQEEDGDSNTMILENMQSAEHFPSEDEWNSLMTNNEVEHYLPKSDTNFHRVKDASTVSESTSKNNVDSLLLKNPPNDSTSRKELAHITIQSSTVKSEPVSLAVENAISAGPSISTKKDYQTLKCTKNFDFEPDPFSLEEETPAKHSIYNREEFSKLEIEKSRGCHILKNKSDRFMPEEVSPMEHSASTENDSTLKTVTSTELYVPERNPDYFPLEKIIPADQFALKEKDFSRLETAQHFSFNRKGSLTPGTSLSIENFASKSKIQIQKPDSFHLEKETTSEHSAFNGKDSSTLGNATSTGRIVYKRKTDYFVPEKATSTEHSAFQRKKSLLLGTATSTNSLTPEREPDYLSYTQEIATSEHSTVNRNDTSKLETTTSFRHLISKRKPDCFMLEEVASPEYSDFKKKESSTLNSLSIQNFHPTTARKSFPLQKENQVKGSTFSGRDSSKSETATSSGRLDAECEPDSLTLQDTVPVGHSKTIDSSMLENTTSTSNTIFKIKPVSFTLEEVSPAEYSNSKRKDSLHQLETEAGTRYFIKKELDYFTLEDVETAGYSAFQRGGSSFKDTISSEHSVFENVPCFEESSKEPSFDSKERPSFEKVMLNPKTSIIQPPVLIKEDPNSLFQPSILIKEESNSLFQLPILIKEEPISFEEDEL